MKNFGSTIRELRESKGLLLRHVAAEMDIDTALLSKVERGERNLKKEQVVNIARIIGAIEKDLLILWLSEKIIDLVDTEAYAEEAIKASLQKIKKNTNLRTANNKSFGKNK